MPDQYHADLIGTGPDINHSIPCDAQLMRIFYGHSQPPTGNVPKSIRTIWTSEELGDRSEADTGKLEEHLFHFAHVAAHITSIPRGLPILGVDSLRQAVRMVDEER